MFKKILETLRRFWAVLKPFWLSVSGPRALLEAWVLAFLMLVILGSLSLGFTMYTLANIIFFTSIDAGFWMALRTRRNRESRWLKVFLKEFLLGMLLGGLTGPGMVSVFVLFQRTQIFELSTFGIWLSIFILACSGLAFYAARAVIWIISFWNNLRKRSLMWSLTHAHLMVVLISAIIGVIILTIYALTEGGIPEVNAQMPPAPRFISRILTTLLPTVGVFTVLTVMALAILLPPSALFSFFFARQTTRRLQKVVQTAQLFRSGNYQARVPVEGEDEVAQLQSDFNGLAETLETTLQELQNEQRRASGLLQSRRQLVASVSHELRTPVATLRSYLEASLEGWKPDGNPALHEDLEIMRRETIRLQTLIDDLFTLSRAEAGGLSLSPQSVDLQALIRERVSVMAPLAWNTSRVEIIADMPASLPHALADPTRLDQVLANLLRNALRYTPPGGMIAVIAAQDGDQLRVDVRDTGSGIVEEDLPYIWDRFYRGNSIATNGDGHSDTSGAGLGLALVKELTEAMGGTVDIESKLGEGSCFTIHLQRAVCDNSATT